MVQWVYGVLPRISRFLHLDSVSAWWVYLGLLRFSGISLWGEGYSSRVGFVCLVLFRMLPGDFGGLFGLVLGCCLLLATAVLFFACVLSLSLCDTISACVGFACVLIVCSVVC